MQPFTIAFPFMSTTTRKGNKKGINQEDIVLVSSRYVSYPVHYFPSPSTLSLSLHPHVLLQRDPGLGGGPGKMVLISVDSTGLPVVLPTGFFLGLLGTRMRSSALGRAAATTTTVSRCGGISHMGAMDDSCWLCLSHMRLSSGLAVEPEMGLVYDDDDPSAGLPRCGEETPYSAGL